MDSSGQTTVLVADVSGGAKLYEAAGYAAALEVIARCIEQVRDAAQSTGGQVVKTNGDKIMVLFATADAAAQAATRMHANIEALPEIGGAKLGVQVGFHSGPVYRCDEDLLGDTVKLASRMVEQARKGQTITSQQTAALLSPSFRAHSRQLDAIQAREKGEGLRLCEIAAPAATGLRRLRLTYRDHAVVCSRENESVVVGRAPGCALVVADLTVSRRHCTITLRDGRFVLQDHSTNGTYVTVEGGADILAQSEEVILGRRGRIGFGRPPDAGLPEAVEYDGGAELQPQIPT
ncbi:MAG TPA: adenylate/guanylate cyclase domain-containing protein [Burkholderiales bacterium]|nr:adenylate/guanylate cyclase domain-containing protein [Burkholderiales bacterium]